MAVAILLPHQGSADPLLRRQHARTQRAARSRRAENVGKRVVSRLLDANGSGIVRWRCRNYGRELIYVNLEVAGGDDNAVGRRRVRPYGGGGCSDSEQSDSHEPNHHSMLGHENLLSPPCRL